MEKREDDQMLTDLLKRKRKLISLREEIKLKSSCKEINVNEKSKTVIPIPNDENCVENVIQDKSVPINCTYTPTNQPSISPPPFSPLTSLCLKQKPQQIEGSDEKMADTISLQLDTPTLLENILGRSSPIPSMSPETQELYDVLTESRLDIENSPCNSYHEDSDDSVKDPDFLVNTSKTGTYQGRRMGTFSDSDETECELSDEENAKRTILKATERNTTETYETEKTKRIISIDNPENNDNSEPRMSETENDRISPTILEISTQNLVPDSTNDETETNTKNVNEKQKDNKRSRKERDESKALRNTGKCYKTAKGKVIPERISKPLKICRLKCDDRFTMAEREQCFVEYWKLGSRDKRACFISQAITILPKKTGATGCVLKNRECYCLYKLSISNEEKPICKECLCRLLDENKGFINVLIEKKKLSPFGIIDSDQRGLKPPKNKKTAEELLFARNHICSFPSYESHYCRKSTNKKYLPRDLSISKMYREYKKTTDIPISLKLYAKCFQELNLSFKKPSKDTCNTCDVLNGKIKVADEEHKTELIAELAEHQSKAEQAYNEKRMDKDLVKTNSSLRAYTFDLQQCLPTPYLTTSVSFYKQQLWSFNLTIHELGNNEATCYMWDETIGARGANQIASCLWHFCQRLPPDVKEIIFYSDTCGGQNKNNIVAMMFLHLVSTHPTIESIRHKFLISGHTHMECDSDHAIIEKTKKRTQMKINHLNDWVQLIRNCKVQNKFNVVVMGLTDFLDFSELKSKKGPYTIKKIDDTGEKFLWQPIKWLQYDKSALNKINFKDNLDRDTPFRSINLKKRGKASNDTFTLKQISEEPLPISIEKKKDLLDLLALVDNAFHDFYKNIRTSNDCVLSDPDVDEIDPDDV